MYHTFGSAIHDSLFAMRTGSKNEEFRCPITDVRFLGRSKNHGFGHEMGRRGSPRAHTLGKRSHGAQDRFKIGPRVPNIIENINKY